MIEKNLYLILNAIKKNGDIKNLTRGGVTYSEIAKLTNLGIKNGLIIYVDDAITLSDLGNQVYEASEAAFKKMNKAEWIEKDFKSQIARIDKNVIFVPRQNELTF